MSDAGSNGRALRDSAVLLLCAQLLACAGTVPEILRGAAPPPSTGGVEGALRLVATGAGGGDDPGRAVVYLRGGTPGPPAAGELPERRLLLLPAGFEASLFAVGPAERVAIENRSGVLHRLFWLEKGRRHEVELGADRGATAGIALAAGGILRLYCALHAEEHVSIFAAPSPHYAVVGFGGSYRMDGVPPGEWTLHLWSERVAGEIREVRVAAGEVAHEDVWIDLRLAERTW